MKGTSTMPMPKGRIHISAATMSGPPSISLWTLDPKPGSTLAQLEQSYLGALEAVDRVAAHKSRARGSGRFTDAGINDDALQFATSKLAPVLHRSRQTIAKAKQEAAERRAQLTLQPPDKSDVVGALRRQRMRAFLRSLPDEKRNRVIGNFNLLTPEMALAIAEMPPGLSGALEADHAQLTDRALEAQHGPSIVELRDLERGIEVAEQAVVAAYG